MTPNITGPVSCAGRDEWVHVYTYDHGDLCFGHVGTAHVAFPNDTYAVCLGNNDAAVIGYALGNGDIDLTYVTIRGWSGHATCAP